MEGELLAPLFLCSAVGSLAVCRCQKNVLFMNLGAVADNLCLLRSCNPRVCNLSQVLEWLLLDSSLIQKNVELFGERKANMGGAWTTVKRTQEEAYENDSGLD